MTRRHHTKIVREGNYVAEVNIELIETGASEKEGWSPYLSLEDALKLDEVREALREGDIKSASRKSKVFVLKPAVI